MTPASRYFGLFLAVCFGATAFAQSEREITDPAEAKAAIAELVKTQTEALSKIETWQGRFECSQRVMSGEKRDHKYLCNFTIDFKKGCKYCDYVNDFPIASQKLLEMPGGNYRVTSDRKELMESPAKAGALISGKAYITFKIDPVWLLVPENLSVSGFLVDYTKEELSLP